MNQKLENLLNLALETPENVREQTDTLNVGFNSAERNWELIVKYHGSLEGLQSIGVKVEELIAGYAILTVPESLVDLMTDFEEIEYVEKPKRYYYEQLMPSEEDCIALVTNRSPALNGQGILIAVLDSGIDYRREDFRKANGETRIRFLWDQTLGEVFDAEQINAALRAQNETEQYHLLPSRDVSGHGTAVAGIAAVLGHITSASAVNSAAVAATQLFSQLAVNFLAPLCGSVLGLSTAGAVHPQLKTDKIGELIKKFVVWGLTLIMTVFMSILSAQTLVASASDNTAIKAAKFMVSQGVPIVGGTISDVVNTFGGSLSVLKGSVGTYGIIAAAVILFPSIARIFCYKIALSCAQALAEMLGLKELGTLMKSCCAVTTIILSVSICFLLLNFSAVILLLAATN